MKSSIDKDIKTQSAYMTVLCPPLASVYNEGAATSTRSSSWVGGDDVDKKNLCLRLRSSNHLGRSLVSTTIVVVETEVGTAHSLGWVAES